VSNPLNWPTKQYNIIYADPPWHFSSGIRSSKKIAGKYQYYTPETTVGMGRYKSTMTNAEIIALPVAELAAQDCALFLWTTDAHLPLALSVMTAWGMPYKTVAFVWNKKEQSGKQVCYYGKWTLKGTELCLLGAKGKANSMLVSHKVRGLVEAPRGEHSVKPACVRDKIVELMGDRPRVELFARRQTPGWDVWGDEV